ncbi:ABC transporter permease [Mesonia sp. K7]|uniref:ABC transporter permease n=1 Tax=Mesonia sp. K7 TaxID=2218606 RepID=UPI000DA92A40|nr:ABC transporter permease [Mesonia sp. K7]PZD79537.1 ABC transporter permease [Mesonia sp. K7]
MHRNLKLIITREYLARVKNKTFVVMTFLSPLIMTAMFFLVYYLTMVNNQEVKTIGILDPTSLYTYEANSTDNFQFKKYENTDLNSALIDVMEKEYDGLLYIPKEIESSDYESEIEFFSNAAGNAIISKIENDISKIITNKKLEKAGVDISKLNDAKTRIDLKIENFSGEKTSKIESYIKIFFGGIAGYLIMMFIIIYGNMIMRSVIEEKTNRIVEIIISSVKPVDLMLGKIIGTSLAGVTQFVLWTIIGSFLLVVVSSVFGVEINQVNHTATAIENNEFAYILQSVMNLPILLLCVMFIIYFVLGYFLYSAIYAAIGAAVDSETDTQQFMFPIIMPLMLAVYVGFFSVINNPHGMISVVFSHIPLTSPIVMLMRIPFGVAWWEILISVLILMISVFMMVRIGAKIYKVGILKYGKKPTFKEMFKWLKY